MVIDDLAIQGGHVIDLIILDRLVLASEGLLISCLNYTITSADMLVLCCHHISQLYCKRKHPQQYLNTFNLKIMAEWSWLKLS